MSSSLSLIDVLTIPGVDHEILTNLHLIDVARLATTCQVLRFRPLEWMLDREILLQLQCPDALRKKILDERSPLQVRSLSRIAKPSMATSVWEALRPIMVDSPLKRCYGLELQIQHPAADCKLHFSNQVLSHSNDITVIESRYYTSTNFTEKPDGLECLCKAKGCCFGGTRPSKYYYVNGRYQHGDYYCNGCLQNNVFVKLRKIRQDPSSSVVWNGKSYKL